MSGSPDSHFQFFNDPVRGAALERLDLERLPRHVAVIMDGNGRWAQSRGLPRTAGHKAGIAAVREAILACDELGIGWLTIYAFSTENWNRPRREVDMLMNLFASTMAAELKGLEDHDARVRLIGNLSALPDKTRRIFEQSIAETKDNKGLTLTMAVNYGGRREIADAVREIAERVAAGELDPYSIDERCVSSHLYDPEAPDPDLLIRTSGEQRLSNFLIWQTAYSEFYITDTLWPDFDRYGLLDALVDFQGRSRRFGKVDGS